MFSIEVLYTGDIIPSISDLTLVNIENLYRLFTSPKVVRRGIK